MANPVNAMYVLEKYEGGGQAAGDLVMQIGQADFTTTGTEKAIDTDLDIIVAAFANAMGGTVDPQDAPIQPDTEVSSDTLTFTRQSSGGSGKTFSYIVVGKKTT